VFTIENMLIVLFKGYNQRSSTTASLAAPELDQ
jgi:hypothetical protein